MNTDNLNTYVDLLAEKRELDAKLKMIKDQLGNLEPLILEDMAEAGMQSTKINGTTLFIKSQLWAGAENGDYARAAQGLRAAGLDEFVQERFNVNSVSSYFRELAKDVDDPAQIELPDGIKLTERFTIGARQS